MTDSEIINRQKAEIDILIRKKEALQDEVAELRAEVERLKDKVEYLYKEIEYVALRTVERDEQRKEDEG